MKASEITSRFFFSILPNESNLSAPTEESPSFEESRWRLIYFVETQGVREKWEACTTETTTCTCAALACKGRPNKRSPGVVFLKGDVPVLWEGGGGSCLTGSRLNRKRWINSVGRSGDVVWPRPGRE